MMAARLMDTTAHGGFISGPGCPSVLIGKMPAARMGDMHVCPMVTPGTPPIPHVGGPITMGCPTVLIGKAPAARQTDMCVCVGPPSSILMGCPTVLIGSGGGGGGGGGGASAKAASAAETLKAGDVSPVEGTETFPIEIQAAILEMAKYAKAEEVKLKIEVIAQALEAGRGQAYENEEPVKLTLADFVEILEAVESEEGYEAARFFASHLDYGEMIDLAREFVHGKEPDPDNDPNQMPTRFMLLYGMEDGKLQCEDDHHDRFENEDHKINVTNLRKGLKLMGYEVEENGPYDAELYRAHLYYLSTVPMGDPTAIDELEHDEGEKKYTVKDGEDLGMIARKFGLPSWKYLYELNKEAVGDNPDMLQSGTKLSIPVWDSTGGEEKIEEKGGKAFKYTGGLRYRYPWVPFQADIIEHATGAPKEFEEKTSVKITNNDFSLIYAEMEITKTDEIKILLPDASFVNIGIRSFPFNHGEVRHIHPDDVAVTEADKNESDEKEAGVKTEQELLNDLLT